MRTSKGYTMIEVLVLIGLIGVISLIALPFYLSYAKAQAIKTAAGELSGILSMARQVAVSTNRRVCVEHDGTKLWFRLSPVLNPVAPPVATGTVGCGAEVWRGAITDASGFVRLTNSAMTITGTSPVEYFGNGSTRAGGIYTVRSTVDGTVMNVRVSLVGHMRIGD